MLQKEISNYGIVLCLAGAASLFLPVACLAQGSSFNIATVVGTGTEGFSGDGGAATSATLAVPIQIALDASHNLYIADSGTGRIRKVSGGKISTVAGNGTLGYTGDGGAATSAELYDPYSVLADASGNFYIADLNNQVVRKVTGTNISTVAGNNTAGFFGDGGPALSAQFNLPFGLALDSAGNLYIADSGNDRIRVVALNGNVTTIAGDGNYHTPAQGAFSGDGGPATGAALNSPYGICLDSAGNLYIADSGNNRIRKIDTHGIITTVAGTGTAGVGGDGGPAVKAQLNRPFDVKVDSAGDLFIADYNNSRIRMVSPSGTIQTIAGGTGTGYTGDGFIATNAQLNYPTGLALDTNGTIYIADSGNNVIRLLTPIAPSLNSVISAGSFGAFPAVAPGSWIEIYGANLAGDQRSWASSDFQGVSAPSSLDGTTVKIAGQSAYLDYISGGQINAQVPSNVPTGSQPLVVTTASGSTASYSVTVNGAQPGLWAPSVFNVGGVQYVGAQFPDGTFAMPPGAVAGVTSRRAKAGDTVSFYGVGFGPVNPSILAGQIVQQANQLVTVPQIFFGPAAATVTSAGLVQTYVGLYQFTVVVPSVTASDKVPVTFTLGSAAGSQTLFIAVQ